MYIAASIPRDQNLPVIRPQIVVSDNVCITVIAFENIDLATY
jgi:hypothetical protein